MTTDTDKLELLLTEIKELRIEIKELKESTSKMDSHIDFVENVFNIIRVPFFTLMNTVNSFIPSIEPEPSDDWNYITNH